MKLNDKAYSILKWLGLIVLPALATLVIAVFEIWGLPYGAQIGATITAISTFIGAIIRVSQYCIDKEKNGANTPENESEKE